jgi:hypothetical protein
MMDQLNGIKPELIKFYNVFLKKDIKRLIIFIHL